MFSAPCIPMEKQSSQPPPSWRLSSCIPAAPPIPVCSLCPAWGSSSVSRGALEAVIPVFSVPLQKSSIHPLGSWEHPRHRLPERLLNFPLSQKKQVTSSVTGWERGQAVSKTGLFFPFFVFQQLLQMSQATANSSAASKVGAGGGFASSLGHHVISLGFSQLLKLVFEQPGSPSGHLSLIPPLAACLFVGLG